MEKHQQKSDSADKTAAIRKKKGAHEPLPSSDDTGYAQAIAGGTVNAPAVNEPAVKPNYLPDEPIWPAPSRRDDGAES